ncbi:hypothetical protein ABK040_005111 [Willaertia magna]
MGNSNARKLFEQLDKDKCGKVSLSELLLNNNETTSPFTSLTTLYHFDMSKEGALNYKEFIEMEKFVQRIRHQVEKEQEKDEHHLSTDVSSLLGKLFGRKDSQTDLSQEFDNSSQLMSFGSISSPSTAMGSVDKLSVKFFTSPSKQKKSEHHHHYHHHHSFSDMVKDKVTEELLPALHKEMYNKEGKQRFLTWLWKLSDIDHTGRITRAELEIILRAVQKDGIDLECLLFDACSTDEDSTSDEEHVTQLTSVSEAYASRYANKMSKKSPTGPTGKATSPKTEGTPSVNVSNNTSIQKENTTSPRGSVSTSKREDTSDDEEEQIKHMEEMQRISRLVERILDEYDIEGHGYLNQQEFMKLGEIILTKYEALHLENQDGKIIGDWKMTHVLGRGSYGVVRLAHHIDDYNEKRAIKVIKRGNVSDMSRLDTEIQAMTMLRHNNVVRLYEVLEDEEYVYIVMELCGGGSLYEHLKDKPFDEELARYYFNQLVDGLSYCHQNGVCHRDLRLENLLLDNEGRLKITDFGQARIFKKGWDLFSTQLVGSLYHLSPEQIEGKVYSGEKIDIWSAGIILYCFVTSRLPFCSSDVMQMFDDIKNARYSYPDDVNVSEECQELIFGMLQTNPNVRANLKQIKGHGWTKGPQKQPHLMVDNMTLEGFFDKNKHIPNLHKIIGKILMDILKQFDVHFKADVKKKGVKLPLSSSQMSLCYGNSKGFNMSNLSHCDSTASISSPGSDVGVNTNVGSSKTEKKDSIITPPTSENGITLPPISSNETLPTITKSNSNGEIHEASVQGPKKPSLKIDTGIGKKNDTLTCDVSPLLPTTNVVPPVIRPFLLMKCMCAKKDLKFSISLEETLDKSLYIVFELRDGETKEFKNKLNKIKPELTTRLTS